MQHFLFSRQNFLESFWERRLVFENPPAPAEAVSAEVSFDNPLGEETAQKLKNLKDAIGDSAKIELAKKEYREIVTKSIHHLSSSVGLVENNETQFMGNFKAMAYGNLDIVLQNEKNPEILKSYLDTIHNYLVQQIKEDQEFILAKSTDENAKKTALDSLLKKNSILMAGGDVDISSLSKLIQIDERDASIQASNLLGNIALDLSVNKKATHIRLTKEGKWEYKIDEEWKEFSIAEASEQGKEVGKEMLESGGDKVVKSSIDAVLALETDKVLTDEQKRGVTTLFFGNDNRKNNYTGENNFPVENISTPDFQKNFDWENIKAKFFTEKDSFSTEKQTKLLGALLSIINEKKGLKEGEGKIAPFFVHFDEIKGEIEIQTAEEKAIAEKDISGFVKAINVSSDNTAILGNFRKACEISPLSFDTNKTPAFKQLGTDGKFTIMEKNAFFALLSEPLKPQGEKIYNALVAEANANTENKELFLSVKGTLSSNKAEVVSEQGIIAKMKMIDKNKLDYKENYKDKVGFWGSILSLFGIDVLDPTQSGGIVSLIRNFAGIPDPGSAEDKNGERIYSYEQDNDIATKYLGADFRNILANSPLTIAGSRSEFFNPPTLSDSLNTMTMTGTPESKEAGTKVKNLVDDVLGRFNTSTAMKDGVPKDVVVTSVGTSKVTFDIKDGADKEKTYVQLMTFLRPSSTKANKASEKMAEEVSEKVGSAQNFFSMAEGFATAGQQTEIQAKVDEIREEPQKEYPDIYGVQGDGISKVTVSLSSGSMMKKIGGFFGFNLGGEEKSKKTTASTSPTPTKKPTAA